MPSVPVIVEKQQFEFTGGWRVVVKYDDSEYYRGYAEPLKGLIDESPQSTRAVDLVGLHTVMGLLLLEVKDFRGHRIDNKRRISDLEIVTEVALKVRDTVAGLVGAARMSVSAFPANDFYVALGPQSTVTVVLWLEDDEQKNVDRAKVQLSTLNGVLKKKLAWLNVRAFVLSSRVQNRIPDVLVSNLKGAGQP